MEPKKSVKEQAREEGKGSFVRKPPPPPKKVVYFLYLFNISSKVICFG